MHFARCMGALSQFIMTCSTTVFVSDSHTLRAHKTKDDPIVPSAGIGFDTILHFAIAHMRINVIQRSAG